MPTQQQCPASLLDWLALNRPIKSLPPVSADDPKTPLDCAIERVTGPIARECDQQAADIARRLRCITEADHLAREMCIRMSPDDAFEVMRLALRIVEEIE